MSSTSRLLGFLLGAVALAIALEPACSASEAAGGSGGGSSGNTGGGGGEIIACDRDCAPQICVPGKGCLDCVPGGTTCVGNSIHACTEAGNAGDLVSACDVSAGQICKDGLCRTECDVVAGAPSNVGCEFWAVDLPNERGAANNAAAQPWGVVLSNAGVGVAEVTIEQNQAGPGQPLALFTVRTLALDPGQLEPVALPQAEVTGWTATTTDPPGPPGTFLSSKAFRITSTAPLVVYQFNNFTNNFSNDASLLLPRNGLGKLYRVLGYPTANPIGLLPVPNSGIPDRTSVTIVGVSEGTEVTVTAGALIATDGASIPATAKGGQIKQTLGPFDVLNLSSQGLPGDLTGTIVEATKPVAVFTAGERIAAPHTIEPPPPPDYEANLCCTDHFEEQLFPVTSLGRRFVISRSPIRSAGGYVEPDILRFLGVAAPAEVTTNLPPPLDRFTLTPGQMVETWTDRDIVVSSTEPISIAQILVSYTFTTEYTGDPSFTIFPPAEQYRSEYQFLIPPSWATNHFVIAAPLGGSYEFDGGALPEGCVKAAAGELDGTAYEAIRCPVGVGTHRVRGDVAFGITVYGYGRTGSYAFSGGADVKPIYDPPPIPR
jgi:hypothetical protein